MRETWRKGKPRSVRSDRSKDRTTKDGDSDSNSEARSSHRKSNCYRSKYSLLCAVFAIQLIDASSTAAKGNIEVDVKIPKEAEVGSSVELKCEWRLLGGNGLYSVKWYKDDYEFFRYVPDDDPKIQTFPQRGVNLDARRSSEKSIRLRELGLPSSGQYKCEVSTEAPSFATTYRTGNLTVIALPERGPEITGLSTHYAVGENVTANCTSWPSVPVASLTWTISGELVPKEKTIRYPASNNRTSLGFVVEAEPRHFVDTGGHMVIRIKCTANIGSNSKADEREIPMAYVNNQRLSAGDTRNAAQPVTQLPCLILLLIPPILT